MKTASESFLYNCWYPAAWGYEIEDNKPFARTFLERPIVIYRGKSGNYTALDNRCCHRAAPLSQGRIEGDCIRCMYHGMKYDSSGKCIEIPGQERIAPSHKVRKYPLVLKGSLLWIWMGEPEKADEADIHNVTEISEPTPNNQGWRGLPKQCYLHYQANWLLIVDNLADFSHLAFVHTNTLGGSEDYAVESAPNNVEKLDDGFHFTRWHKNSGAPPYHAKVSPEGADKVDRCNIVSMFIPGIFFMETLFAPVGWNAETDSRDKVREYRNCQFMTPETRNTTHFFWDYFRNYRQDEVEVSHSLSESMMEGFMEDKVIIEAQQKLIELEAPFQPGALLSDESLVHFRHIWDKSIQEERKTYNPNDVTTKVHIL